MSPTFVAECMSCQCLTGWVKTNRIDRDDTGEATVLKGFRCTSCDQFQTTHVDTRGRLQVREG